MCFCDSSKRTPCCGSKNCLDLCHTSHPKRDMCKTCEPYLNLALGECYRCGNSAELMEKVWNADTKVYDYYPICTSC